MYEMQGRYVKNAYLRCGEWDSNPRVVVGDSYESNSMEIFELAFLYHLKPVLNPVSNSSSNC